MAVLPLLSDGEDKLTPQQQILLTTLAHQPGFEILVKLFDSACTRITQKLVNLNPEDEQYKRKLEEYHLESRAINGFCSSVLSAIDFHSESIRRRDSDDKDEKARLIEAAAQLLRPGNPYGRNIIKSGE